MNKTSPSIDYVMSLTPGGMHKGRDNVLKLMKILGNPQNSLEIFHVTGSNGKGSVCQMISQVLWKKFGKKVGLFTSPHFITLNERFQINGKPIEDNVLESYYAKVLQLANTYSIPLSFFEIQVVVMVLYFTDVKVDYAVIEVGLGGTYDGTNIFHHPLACFITSITLEHTHILGKSRSSILKNKLGILKKGTHLYTPIKDILIEATCKKLGVTLSVIKSPTREITNLPGKHQQGNAEMVLKALTDVGFEEKEILKGLQDIYNPGRFEWITPTVLVDTANNEENIEILGKMVKGITKNKKTTIIFGTTHVDAGYARKLSEMIPGTKRILIDDFCDRSLPCSSYIGEKHDECIHLLRERGKIEKLLTDEKTIKIIYGSFYLIGEIMILSRYKPFASR